jgi:hypothetical protein
MYHMTESNIRYEIWNANETVRVWSGSATGWGPHRLETPSLKGKYKARMVRTGGVSPAEVKGHLWY